MSDDFTLPDGVIVSANLNNFESAHRQFAMNCKWCAIQMKSHRSLFLYKHLQGFWAIVRDLGLGNHCFSESSVDRPLTTRMHRFFRISYENRATSCRRIERRTSSELPNCVATAINVATITACR